MVSFFGHTSVNTWALFIQKKGPLRLINLFFSALLKKKKNPPPNVTKCFCVGDPAATPPKKKRGGGKHRPDAVKTPIPQIEISPDQSKAMKQKRGRNRFKENHPEKAYVFHRHRDGVHAASVPRPQICAWTRVATPPQSPCRRWLTSESIFHPAHVPLLSSPFVMLRDVTSKLFEALSLSLAHVHACTIDHSI